MHPIVLTKPQARAIMLNAAGLARPAQFGTGPEAVYQLIDHLGFVQLDTNYTVERAHHHVMHARIPGYEPQWLWDLVEDGRVYEYFTSDAGYMLMHDFRFSLPVKQAFAMRSQALTKPEITLAKQVLDRIEREGPLMVGDFEQDRLQASTGWWDWRPAKIALERLYLEGKLMITRNQKFHKVYDIPLNLVPADVDLTMPSPSDYARFVIKRTLGALGIAYAKEIAWRTRFVKDHLVKQELEKMTAAGELLKVNVEGVKGAPLYMLPGQPVDVALSGDVFILSPFDVLNVFRHRLRDFFDFDYQIECFVPAPKRKYGYFSLPILAGDRFIARMDAKADRKSKTLIVNNLHFEDDVMIDEEIINKFIESLKAFTKFNQCRDVKFIKCNRTDYLEIVGKQL